MIRLIKNSRFSVFLLILGLGFFVASCGCEEDCAEFSKFQMCESAPTKDGCSDNQNTFSQDADFLTVSLQIKHGEPDDRLSGKYYFKDGNSFTEFFSVSKPLKELDEDVDGSERLIKVSTAVTRPANTLWPKGEYKVEVELTQENTPLNQTRNFTVQ